MNPIEGGGEGDPLRALDERIGLLIARLRDVAEERDALRREIDAMRDRAAGLETAARRAAAVDASRRVALGEFRVALRSAVEELRTD